LNLRNSSIIGGGTFLEGRVPVSIAFSDSLDRVVAV